VFSARGASDLFNAKKLPNTLAASHDEDVVRRTDCEFLEQHFSTAYSTVGENFDAKQRNSAQRTAKAELRITWRQQRYAKQ
jgi:hypothetical protein